jgi:Arc/MetJ-type ribon-helix-helix transcriptional regulator
MISTHISLEKGQFDFVNQYQQYGFKDQNELIQAALRRLQEELELRHLQESAELYAELYESDRELQDLTNSALLESS